MQHARWVTRCHATVASTERLGFSCRLIYGVGFDAYRGRTASCPAAPAQIPACGFPAPGFLRRCSGHASDTLACAPTAAIAASEVGTVARPCMSGSVSCRGYVCLSAPSPCARLARLRVLWADRSTELTTKSDSPCVCGFPTCAFASACLIAQERLGPPKACPEPVEGFSTFLCTHAALFVDPGRPSAHSP